ncbi:MAG: pirin family protein [Candidatus Thioglobus sp.]|nr:pirin family protein [Candidatus Thioglobus pontius]MBL6976847.1 pirin family protein [Candidatus Thioglobus sp.]MBL6984696.1 pirin family protein [Candidatus Thioglobus sp.]
MLTKAYPQETFEGDGVVVKRLFPISKRMNFDPFVLWDHFDISAGHGFPDHPHRGFEAITYMLSGGVHHKDNLNNDAFVDKGGAQVFCAGGGIVHSEMPAEEGQSIGIQLWVNLPKHLKAVEPSYQQVLNKSLPIVHFEGGNYRTIVGEGSPVKLHTDVNYQHVSLRKSKYYQTHIDRGFNVIVYVLSGKVIVKGEEVSSNEAVLMENQQDQQLSIKADQDSEFMFCCGLSHHEPINQHGPYVD